MTIDAIRRVKAGREEQLSVFEDDDDKGPPAELAADPEAPPDRLAERGQVIRKVQQRPSRARPSIGQASSFKVNGAHESTMA